MQYPMYVMPIADFVARYKDSGRVLEPHQDLLAAGRVKVWNGVDDCLFISHEWTGYAHPDPRGQQTKELVLFLDRLRSGQIPSIEESWEHFGSLRTRIKVEAREWAEILSHACIWLECVRGLEPC
jgi:hypothetical protein